MFFSLLIRGRTGAHARQSNPAISTILANCWPYICVLNCPVPTTTTQQNASEAFTKVRIKYRIYSGIYRTVCVTQKVTHETENRRRTARKVLFIEEKNELANVDG